MPNTTTLEAASHLVEPFLTDLRALVDVDSGTYTPAGVAVVADYLQPRFAALGAAVERIAGDQMGPQLVSRLRGQGQGRVLLIGHMDTVFPEGEVARRPFRLENGRAYGPGVLDMKSGLLVGLYALRLLLDTGELPFSELTFICNSDEEIGSPESKPLIQRLARDVDAAFVLEPTADVAVLKVARKGVGTYRLDVTGVSSHAGVKPEDGRNAILELAHKIIAIQALNGALDGLTLNVGVTHGGERPNVVPDAAHALIDIRVASPDHTSRVEDMLRQIASDATIAGTIATITGHFAHQPFVQSERAKQLFALAAEEAAAFGLTLRGEATGGGSDGNTTAALGIPTLDGLGPAGGLAHNPGEYVEVASIAPRIALLASTLRRMGALS
ncbi:MAG: M20 family metallopeptidase [Ktedonobacterales bacterium]|jgi:glutamate carboxypeptidase|nr:MAG: M20 family metallopeptidase [Ktedonobacterales bacterium]